MNTGAHRAERDEVPHARAAHEEQKRHQQREQHGDREVRLQRGEHVEHADHRDERNQSLGEAAQVSPFFTISIETHTTTASFANSDG